MRAELARLLTEYKRFPLCEGAHVEQGLELLRHHSASTHRESFDPGHFTVSAYIVDAEQRLLLIAHPKLQCWLQPGGHIEPVDTSPLETAKREILEETGLRDLTLLNHGLVDFDIHDIPKSPKEPAHQHFDLRFLFRCDAGTADSSHGEHPIKWFTVSNQADAEPGLIERAFRVIHALDRIG